MEREGWEATAVSAVTGTRDCEHHPCNGMVRLVMESKSMEVEEESRWLKRGRKSRILVKCFGKLVQAAQAVGVTPPSRGVSAFGIVPSAGVSLSTTGPPGAGTAVTHCHDTIFFSTDRSSPDVVKVLDGHRDVVLGGEEEAVGDLAGVLRVGGFSVGVPRVELHPVLHFRSVKTRHHFVHNVLQSFVSPGREKG